MSAENFHQIYLANPSTVNLGTDIIPFIQSPYTPGKDSGILFSDFLAQLPGVTNTQVQQNAFNVGTDTGIADAYVVNLNPPVASLTKGLMIIFSPVHNNLTTSPTLQLNANAPANIQLPSNNGSVAPGDLNGLNGSLSACIYNDITGNFELLTPFVSYMTTGQIQDCAANTIFDTNATPNVYIGNTTLNQISFQFFNLPIYFIPSATNTGPSTLNANSEGNINIVLPTGGSLQGGELIQNNVYILLRTNTTTWTLINPSVNYPSKTILAPTTGNTITLLSTNNTTIINPAGTLLTLTINMPPTPVNNQNQKVTFTQAITTLTVNGNGHSIIGQPTSAIIGQSFTMIYDAGTTTWYPG